MDPERRAERQEFEGKSPEREEQQRAIEEAAKERSWLQMLLRRRRESRGKPKRRSPSSRPWFRWWK